MEANKIDPWKWRTGCEKALQWAGSVAGTEANKIDVWKWRTGCEKALRWAGSVERALTSCGNALVPQ